MKLFSSWHFYSIQNVVKLGLLNLTRVLCCSQYRKDTEPLYNYFMYSLVSLLSGIYPLPAMHSLLVTSDVRNIKQLSQINLFLPKFKCSSLAQRLEFV